VNLVLKAYYSHMQVSQEYFLALDSDSGPAKEAVAALISCYKVRLDHSVCCNHKDESLWAETTSLRSSDGLTSSYDYSRSRNKSEVPRMSAENAKFKLSLTTIVAWVGKILGVPTVKIFEGKGVECGVE
jgi:hypothetical protein